MVWDFDKIVDRHNTDSFKWDMNMEYFGRDDIIPMWVADMDFPCAEPIVRAIKNRAEHPIFGYTVRTEKYYEAVIGWLARRHNCKIDRSWLTFAPPGVIYAIYVMLQIVTVKGDKVIVQMPNYDPLFDLVVKSGRTLVENPLKKREDGKFTFDFEDLKEKIKQKPKALVLSSPHNPTGRVWTREELITLAGLCIENDVYMIIDEIHADFVPKECKHTAFASLGEEIAKKSMVCYSANKGFNLGGLQMASLVIADHEKRRLFDQQMMIAQTRLDNTFGTIAMETAYSDPECEEWLDQAIEYVSKNKAFLKGYLEAKLPQIKMIPSEGTYLAWLDCTELGLGGKALEEFMINKVKIAFSSGYEFGKEGERFVRINLACPRKLLEKAVNQLREAVSK